MTTVSRRSDFLRKTLLGIVLLPLGWLLWSTLAVSSEPPVRIPPPALDEPAAAATTTETVVLAGGCFWGVQAVYQHTNGVLRAVSGYAGGTKETADYELVSRHRTRHAEAVEITFDPRAISLGTVLQIFFSVAHDPTQVDRQGPDIGEHYRSAIFPRDERQARHAAAYIAQLDKAKVYPKPIATKLEGAAPFYAAEDYHQDYATLHPNKPYIVIHDRPKIDNLRQIFPAQYRAAPVLVGAVAKR